MSDRDGTGGGDVFRVSEDTHARHPGRTDGSRAITSLGTATATHTRPNLLASLADAASSALPSRSGIDAAGLGKGRPRSKADTGDESEEGSEDDAGDGNLFGSLKTNLVWDCTGRRLCLLARQFVETPRKLELRWRGMLDTASGQHRVWGHVRRNFYTHTTLLERLLAAQDQRERGGWVDEPNLDPEAFLPGGLRCLLFQDWSIAPGVGYDTARCPPLPPSISAGGMSAGGASSGGGAAGVGAAGGYGGGNVGLATLLGQRVRYQLEIRKNPQVIKNGETADIWVQARALAEFDPKASEVSLGGNVRLKIVKYGITGSQDLRLTLGLDVAQDGAGRMNRMPYIHVSDGKLGAKLHNRRWQLTYTL